jgi:poly(A)-specific ribonuclease
MDITKENFLELLPRIQKCISEAEFIAIDEEMTGINLSDPSLRYRKDETIDARYLKMFPVANRFNIIQFGLCTFRKVELISDDNKENAANAYVASPFNFYLFPSGGQDIVMSASSIDFLRKNGMNFQTWIGNGLTYVNERGEEFLSKKFLDFNSKPQNAQPETLIHLTKQSDIEFMEAAMSGLKDMINDPDKFEFVFQSCNSYLRKVIYQQVELNFPDITLSKDKAGNFMAKKNKSEEEELALKAIEKAEKMELFKAQMGFRLIFNSLTEAKKPIVGHNCLFDIMFAMRSFDLLPVNSFDDFRTRVHTKFPLIFDTKFIAEEAFSSREGSNFDTTLEGCEKRFIKERENPVKITIEEGFEFSDATKFHNAGFRKNNFYGVYLYK